MNKDTEHKGIRIPKELIEKINKSAQKEERTFSQQVIYILKKYYELQESGKWKQLNVLVGRYKIAD